MIVLEVVSVGSVGEAPVREPLIDRDLDWGVSDTVDVSSSLADSDSVRISETVLDG